MSDVEEHWRVINFFFFFVKPESFIHNYRIILFCRGRALQREFVSVETCVNSFVNDDHWMNHDKLST